MLYKHKFACNTHTHLCVHVVGNIFGVSRSCESWPFWRANLDASGGEASFRAAWLGGRAPDESFSMGGCLGVLWTPIDPSRIPGLSCKTCKSLVQDTPQLIDQPGVHLPKDLILSLHGSE